MIVLIIVTTNLIMTGFDHEPLLIITGAHQIIITMVIRINEN